MIEVKVRTVYPRSGDGFHSVTVSVGSETLYSSRIPCHLEGKIAEAAGLAINYALVGCLALKGAGVEAKIVEEECIL